jgi:hypothetical protein
MAINWLGSMFVCMKQLLIGLSLLAIFGACSAQSSTADTSKSTDTAAKKSRHFVTRNVKSDSKNQVKSQAGGAGIQVFRFKAIKPGTTTIRFI